MASPSGGMFLFLPMSDAFDGELLKFGRYASWTFLQGIRVVSFRSDPSHGGPLGTRRAVV
jgi:hypothetical protein